MSSLFGNFQADSQPDFPRLFAERTSSASPLLDIKNNDHPAVGGYFVFPPPLAEVGGRLSSLDTHGAVVPPVQLQPRFSPSHKIAHDSKRADDTETVEENGEEKRQIDEKRKRLEKEREMATIGEFEWVRSGGILRDSQGRRDKVRTESIRQEIRVQEREKFLTDRWKAYEAKWRALLTGDGPVHFKDMPWPCPSAALRDLTFDTISHFLLEPLEVRTNTVTKRERIRTSLLRWHPDKIAPIFCRVVEEDIDKVREGIGAVCMCLRRMKEN